ncbi:hypothetical protein GW758_04200 [Candidatus Falkowbacteria bacterium]|nr:hypothetical protein [Candidatus Falkowbacteria bacterium]
METINILTILFVSAVVVYVQTFMNKEITAKQIADTQKALDLLDKKNYDETGILWKHDAEAELLYDQKNEKALLLFFASSFLIDALIILALVATPSLTNIAIILVSAMSLICHGMIKMSADKMFPIKLGAYLLGIAVVGIYIFNDVTTTMSPNAYAYVMGAVMLFVSLNLFRKTEKA